MSGHARNHAEQRLHRTELTHLLKLSQEVVQTKSALGHFGCSFLSFFLIKLLLRLFNQSENITHIENARRHAVWVEDLKILQTFTGRREQNWLTSDARHRQGSTTARIAIHLGEDYTSEINAFVEGLCGGYRILTNHGVDNEQNLMRINSIANIARLLHEFFINTQTTCGINNHRIVHFLLSVANRIASHLHRIASVLTWSGSSCSYSFRGNTALRRENFYAGALAHNLQLGNSIWTLQISSHQQRRVTSIFKPITKFSRQGSLTSTLQTGQHNNCWRILSEVEWTINACTQNSSKLFVHDRHHLLSRIERIAYFRAERALANASGEGAYNVHGYVGIEKSTTDFANSAVNIRFRQFTLRTQVLKSVRQAIGEGTECSHKSLFFHCSFGGLAG